MTFQNWRAELDYFYEDLGDRVRAAENEDTLRILMTDIHSTFSDISRGYLSEKLTDDEIGESFPELIDFLSTQYPDVMSPISVTKLRAANSLRNDVAHAKKTVTKSQVSHFYEDAAAILGKLLEDARSKVIVAENWDCPKCQASNSRNNTHCYQCGFNYQAYLSEMEKKELEAAEKAKQAEEKAKLEARGLELCPFCRHENVINAAFCGGCGKSLEDYRDLEEIKELEEKLKPAFQRQRISFTLSLIAIILFSLACLTAPFSLFLGPAALCLPIFFLSVLGIWLGILANRMASKYSYEGVYSKSRTNLALIFAGVSLGGSLIFTFIVIIVMIFLQFSK